MEICAVDIEATYSSFHVGGAKRYTVRGRTLRAGPYRSFRSLTVFLAYLVEFPGILVGHNWLMSDLLEIQNRFGRDVSKIVPKSVDTMAILYSRNGDSFAGLGLDELGAYNLGGGKKHLAWYERGYQVWATDPRRLMRHNHLDCRLAARLWHHLILHREVIVAPSVGGFGDGRIREHVLRIDDRDALMLRRPHITYRQWRTWGGSRPGLLRKRRDERYYRLPS